MICTFFLFNLFKFIILIIIIQNICAKNEFDNQLIDQKKLKNDLKLFIIENNQIKKRYSFGSKNNDKFNLNNLLNQPNIYKYPISFGLETDFGEQFEIEYDFKFEYLDLSGTDDVYLRKEYTGKWIRDSSYKFNIIHSIDEEKNQNLTTYYDEEIKLSYDIIDNKCIKYNLKDEFNYTFNWFYMQDIITNFKIFNIGNDNENFKFLGIHKLKDINYRIFENIIHSSGKKIINGRKNLNNINPKYFVATHYYDLSNGKIPKIIKIRLFNNIDKLIGEIEIKIKEHHYLKSIDEKIDLSKCFKDLDSIDYRKLSLQLIDHSNSIKLLNKNYIKYEFRKLINKFAIVSPLRIDDIKLIIKDDLIELSAKIIDPINSLQYFNRNEKLNEGSVVTIKNLINQELCARTCIEFEYCSAYFYQNKDDNKNRICKLWNYINRTTNSSIYNKLDNNLINSNYTKFERLTKYYKREHQSTNKIFNTLMGLINENKFDFIVEKDNNKIKFNLIKYNLEDKKSRLKEIDDDDDDINFEDENSNEDNLNLIKYLKILISASLVSIISFTACTIIKKYCKLGKIKNKFTYN